MGLQSERPKKVYPCTQQELYTIVETGWTCYAERLADFMNYSTLYTATTGTDQMVALTAARAMPDEDSRDEVHMTLRLQMIDLAETCLTKWMDMSTYIRDGFPKNEYENKRQAAGHSYYEAAEGHDWESVKGLMQNGVGFANDNSTELTNGGMPATFITELTDAKTAFETKYNAFIQSEEQAKMDTDAKILANNDLYVAMTSMFEDGKRIFRKDAAMREQFTFDRIWDLVKGGGGGSSSVPADTIEIGAYVFDRVTELPISGAILRVLNAPEGVVEVVTDDNGIAVAKVTGYAPNATVTVDSEAEAVGYETVFGTTEMTAGNFYSVEVPMDPVVTP